MSSGWHISAYAVDHRYARVAVWQSGYLHWIDELIRAGLAEALGSQSGYPNSYRTTAGAVRHILKDPPFARHVWACGPDDVLTDKWIGKTLIDHELLDKLAPGDVIEIVAWDKT